ncbi:uncharacterized protein K441DRAFT_593829 [Cenococcum geophilum 1.58]|uniref:Uncharacterized protein n=1 Tax=Cenococcum geophilum 1.58 TaxID=794803 RepID=A0ACC8EMH9_9PEZI|nr:hypothetical protein K441DRAFT_593829 [Cenococcum geophilum 1.58]
MPNFTTSSEWFEQSSLLLKARPTTTKITSKYSVLKPNASKIRKQKEKSAAKSSSKPPSNAPSEPSVAAFQATFTLKTYDPESGTCLKYRTDKAAEVGRLISSLGKLGRHMAALPEVIDDLSAPADQGTGTHTPIPEGASGKDVRSAIPESKSAPQAGGGGGKKKKKGKK